MGVTGGGDGSLSEPFFATHKVRRRYTTKAGARGSYRWETHTVGAEQMKADLVRAIRQIVRRRRLTQVQAAKILGVNQPKVSALMRGHLAGFSTDRLIRLLKALDRDVEIVIKPKPKASGRLARVQVRAA